MKMRKYFSKPFNSHFGDSIKVKLDLSNYATKTSIKNILHVNTSGFALKTNLGNLKTEVDKLDIGKLVAVTVDSSKLSDLVKSDVAKKTEYDKLAGKVNNIDTSGFFLKTKYAADKLELKKKIADASNLAKNTNYNTKIAELENKIPDISNLATKSPLTTAENKIPDTSNLVKKTDNDTKVKKIEKKLLIIIMINILILQNLVN